jgi:hypothetical protein
MKRCRALWPALWLLLPVQAFADIANNTPKFTATLPTQDTGCPTCVPPVQPATIPPWGSTGQNAFQFVKIHCDGALKYTITAPTQVTTPATTAVVYQSLLGDFADGTHICYATYKLYSKNESVPSNNVTFVIARPIFDPQAGTLSVE